MRWLIRYSEAREKLPAVYWITGYLAFIPQDQALEDEDQALEDPADEPPTAGDPQATQSYLIETVEGAADSSNSPTAHLAAAALTPLPSDSDEEEDGVHDPLDTAFEAQHDPPDAAFEAQHDALTAADADSGAGGEDSKYVIASASPHASLNELGPVFNELFALCFMSCLWCV